MPKTVDKKTKTPVKTEEKVAVPVAIKKNTVTKPINDKPINVPVMRCVSQLKTLLNEEVKNKIENFNKINEKFLTKEAEFHKSIRENKKNEPERKKTLKEFDTWKNDDSNKVITKEITNLRKSIYRISGPASKYVSQILEVIIRHMLSYGITNSTQSGKNNKQPKLLPKDFKDMSEDNVSIFPLIVGLKSLEFLKDEKKESLKEDKKEDVETEADEHEGEEDKKDKKKGPPTYKMVIYNIFKRIVQQEQGSKLCCSGTCKQFISNILMEFVERLQFYLSVLVGNTANTSTINEKHVLNACKLMYYNVHRNTDQYSKFNDGIVEMYNTKFQKTS